MKRITGAILLSLLMAVPLFAQDNQDKNDQGKKGRLNIWGGYTTVTMSDFNDSLDALVANRRGASTTKIENGWLAGIEYLYRVQCKLFVGPRVEYIMTNQGKASASSLAGSAEFKQDLSLVPIMVGGRYHVKEWEKRANVNVGLFVGWGLAYGKQQAKLDSIIPGISYDASSNIHGNGFVGDILVGGQYMLSKSVALGLDLGYRYAPISEMKYDDDVTALGVKKDDPVTNTSGDKLKFDYSGLIANLGLSFLF